MFRIVQQSLHVAVLPFQYHDDDSDGDDERSRGEEERRKGGGGCKGRGGTIVKVHLLHSVGFLLVSGHVYAHPLCPDLALGLAYYRVFIGFGRSFRMSSKWTKSLPRNSEAQTWRSCNGAEA